MNTIAHMLINYYQKLLTVSLSISKIFIPGPDSFVILLTYNLIANITSMMMIFLSVLLMQTNSTKYFYSFFLRLISKNKKTLFRTHKISEKTRKHFSVKVSIVTRDSRIYTRTCVRHFFVFSVKISIGFTFASIANRHILLIATFACLFITFSKFCL